MNVFGARELGRLYLNQPPEQRTNSDEESLAGGEHLTGGIPPAEPCQPEVKVIRLTNSGNPRSSFAKSAKSEQISQFLHVESAFFLVIRF